MKRFGIMLVVALIASGCGTAVPTMAGGKPVSYWVQELQSPDAKLRRKAVQKLGNVGPADAAVLPALMGALRDPDAKVRGEAILALLKCGPEARESAPTLAELRDKDPNAEVRTYAAKALAKIQEGKDATD